ncbi:MAG: hypothetical protein BIFFINMI_02483 [Phycisphaerae bacterium]|nr:hypothetical protein [Phycisphaerae bacterium]
MDESRPKIRRRQPWWMWLIVAGMIALPLGFWGSYEAWTHLVFVKRFEVVEPGVLYRSAQPESKTCWPIFKSKGVTAVIDLRVPWEVPRELAEREETEAARHGIRMVRIPMLTRYPMRGQLIEALRTIRGNEGACLVHCQHGRSRTGLVVAAYRVVVQGWDSKRAIAEMRDRGAELDGREEGLYIDFLEEMERNRPAWLACTSPADDASTQPAG